MDPHHRLLPCCKKWGSNESEQDRACATAWQWTHISYRFMGCRLLEDQRLQSQALELQAYFSWLLLLVLLYNAINLKTQAKATKSLTKDSTLLTGDSSSFSTQHYIPWPPLNALCWLASPFLLLLSPLKKKLLILQSFPDLTKPIKSKGK